MNGVADCRLFQVPKISDPRGNLSFLEGGRHVPFGIQRAYWVYDVPGGEARGGHANRHQEELFIALSGSFDVLVDDGRQKRVVSLNRSYVALHVPNLIWRRLENFSTNAVCLVLSSGPYAEEDCSRDYERFCASQTDQSHAHG